VDVHPEIGCEVHSDDELGALLGAPVQRRTQLQCWPLSLVEEIETAAGARWVYKAQRLMPVEPRFYRAVAGRTSVVPAARVLTDDGASSTMLLEHLGQPVAIDGLSEAATLALAHEVVDAIATLPGGLPSHLDWGSVESWAGCADWVTAGLVDLVGDGRFVRVDAEDIAFLRSWSRSPAVRAAVQGPTRLTCNDIKLDQVFRRGDGSIAVVDWALPVVAPGELDLVGLLESAGIDSLGHVDAAVFGMYWFRLVHWAVLAKVDLLPDMPELFDVWAALGIDKVRRAAGGV
jgi:hypothetical protein